MNIDPVLNCAWEDRPAANRWSGWLTVAPCGLVMDSRGLGQTLARKGDNLAMGSLGPWWARVQSDGSAVQRVGSVRVFAEAEPQNDAWTVLVTWASDEEVMAQSLAKAQRERDCLIRLSRSLLHSSSLSLLAVSATQALASSFDLQGCLLWVKEEGTPDLVLAAMAGVHRGKAAAISRLTPAGPPCSAWLASVQGKRLFLDKMERSGLCMDVEGKLTLGEGGAVYVTPLLNGGELVGVLELIGKRDDSLLPSQLTLLDQMAGILAMAIDRAAAYERVEKQASFDSLTGIANHRTMQDFLRGRLAECSRLGQPLAAVMIDVDYFRQFNEREGHDAGDQVLKDVARALTRSIRAYDLAARYGGEEFALILPGASQEEALKAAERVRAAVEALEPRGSQKVTVSCGVALYPEASEEPTSLLKAADSALYKAKRLGRNQVCLYDVEGSAGSPGLDLGMAVVTSLPDELRDEAIRTLNEADPIIQALGQELGLRLGHLEILAGGAAAWSAWRLPEPPAGLQLEVGAGDLRALAPLLRAGSEGLFEGAGLLEEAFVLLLARLGGRSPSSRSEDAA